MRPRSNQHQFAIHGLAVDLACYVQDLREEMQRILGGFRVYDWPAGFVPTSGSIWPYEEQAVLKHLSPTACRVQRTGLEPIELYEENERFWLVDDRWGLAEINLLKGTWNSWILPQTTLDNASLFEMAVLWPMSQLLRGKGLTLIPAASVARDDWGVLLISPVGLEPELRALIGAGFKIIGQRWTALREDSEGVNMLHLPGMVETAPKVRTIGGPPAPPNWIDLLGEYCGAGRKQAYCDTVLLIEPGRRPRMRLAELNQTNALPALRACWPICELHPQRRYGQMPAKLARRCRCWDVQLSTDPRDLLMLLDTLRGSRPRRLTGPSRAMSRVQVSLPRLPVLRAAV